MVVPLWRYGKAKSEHTARLTQLDHQLADLRAELIRAKDRAREAEAERDDRIAVVAKARDELLAALPE